MAPSDRQTDWVTLAEIGRLTIAWDNTAAWHRDFAPWHREFNVLIVPTGHHADDFDGSLARALADRLGAEGWAAFKDAARQAIKVAGVYAPDAPILFKAPMAARVHYNHRYYVLATVFNAPQEPVSAGLAVADLFYQLADAKLPPGSLILFPMPGAGDGRLLAIDDQITQVLRTAVAMRPVLAKLRPTTLCITSLQHPNLNLAKEIVAREMATGPAPYNPWNDCDRAVRMGLRYAERVLHRVMKAATSAVMPNDLLGAIAYLANQNNVGVFFNNSYAIILSRICSTELILEMDEINRLDIIDERLGNFDPLSDWMEAAKKHARADGRKQVQVYDLMKTADDSLHLEHFDPATLRAEADRLRDMEKKQPDLTGIKVEGEEVTFDPEVMATLEEMVQSSSTTGPPPPLNTRYITSFNSDDIDGEDFLGVDRDAKAFADLICLRAAKPPLSIGLFGHWGSGKSFFMGRIKEKIKGITAEARQTKDSPFCGTVVPIHFNAWHYVEQNLWASLVHHLFQELDAWIRREREQAQTQPDKLFERLATARRLTFEALEELVTLGLVARKAEEEAQTARTEHRDKVGVQRQLTAGDMTGVIRKVFEDDLSDEKSETRKALSDLGRSLGIDNLHQRTAEVVELWRSGYQARERANVLLRTMWQSTGVWHLLALLGVTAGLPIGAELLRSWAAQSATLPWLQNANLAIGEAVVACTALLGLSKHWIDKARPVLKKLDDVRSKLQELASKTEAAHLQKVAAAEAAAEQSRLALQDSERRLNRAQETLAAAEHAFAAQSTAGRLTRFIRERAGGGDYSRHLTLVATIRKDFQSLADLMRMNEKGGDRQLQERLRHDSAFFTAKLDALLTQHQKDLPDSVIDAITRAKPSDKMEDQDYPVFDRIVLYIDDLDRCPPEKVVEVLQAVHLLLAFDLFVVVVAVDVRWVEEALRKTYPGMLDGAGGDKGVSSAASPRDYLEKIFNIPFWVPTMDGEGSRNFLLGLMNQMPLEYSKPVKTLSMLAAEARKQQREFTEYIDPSEVLASNDIDIDDISPDVDGGENYLPPIEEDGDDEYAVDQPEAVGTPPAPVKVLAPLSDIDREEINEIAPLLGGGPRQTKRFLNVYQLLKTQLSQSGDGKNEDQRVIAISLAFWLGHNTADSAREREAIRGRDAQSDLTMAMGNDSPILESFCKHLEQRRAKFDLDANSTDKILARISPLAQRFTFSGPPNIKN